MRNGNLCIVLCNYRTFWIVDRFHPSSLHPSPVLHAVNGTESRCAAHTSRRASLSVEVMNTPQTSQTVMVRSLSVAFLNAAAYSSRVSSSCFASASDASMSPLSASFSLLSSSSARAQIHPLHQHCSIGAKTGHIRCTRCLCAACELLPVNMQTSKEISQDLEHSYSTAIIACWYSNNKAWLVSPGRDIEGAGRLARRTGTDTPFSRAWRD